MQSYSCCTPTQDLLLTNEPITPSPPSTAANTVHVLCVCYSSRRQCVFKAIPEYSHMLHRCVHGCRQDPHRNSYIRARRTTHDTSNHTVYMYAHARGYPTHIQLRRGGTQYGRGSGFRPGPLCALCLGDPQLTAGGPRARPHPGARPADAKQRINMPATRAQTSASVHHPWVATPK